MKSIGFILAMMFGGTLAVFHFTANTYQFWALLAIFTAYGVNERIIGHKS
jgi:hypothetical protein